MIHLATVNPNPNPNLGLNQAHFGNPVLMNATQ